MKQTIGGVHWVIVNFLCFLPKLCFACFIFLFVESCLFAHSLEGDIVGPTGLLNASYKIDFMMGKCKITIDNMIERLPMPGVSSRPQWTTTLARNADGGTFIGLLGWPPLSLHDNVQLGEFSIQNNRLVPIPSVSMGSMAGSASRCTVCIAYIPAALIMLLISLVYRLLSRLRNSRVGFEVREFKGCEGDKMEKGISLASGAQNKGDGNECHCLKA